MEKRYRKTAKITLILVYLVIIAGAVVRMTGSGMGCPDWPKCFGYYIPPTEESELQWEPHRLYKKGQVIIRNESLKVANTTFVTSTAYNNTQWNTYTRHDYAIFNVWHTWIEYINRLLGALAGLATLALALVSLKYWKKRKNITLLSWGVVIAIGFQGWLGAQVVYSVLAPVKITIHMIMALAIVGLLLYLIYTTKKHTADPSKNNQIASLLIFSLLVTGVQIVLGTQVRQFVDIQIDSVGEHLKKLWLQNPTFIFYIHRSFSILVLLLNSFIAYRIYTKKIDLSKIKWVLLCILLEAGTGIAMYYFDFPFLSQPLHLVLASFLFGIQFYLILEALKIKAVMGP